MEAYKIGGAYNPGYDTTSPYLVGKGGGSAYGAQWKPQINYPEEQYPNGAPEFKCLCNGVIKYMELICNEEEMRFKTISEFKNSLERGGEIVIEWKDSKLGIFNDGKTYYITSGDGSLTDYDSIDELLERYICRDRLRDVITQVTVMNRAL